MKWIIGVVLIVGLCLSCEIQTSTHIPDIPPDYQLLKAIFGSYDADSTTFTRSHKEWEPHHPYYKKVQFSVSYTKQLVLEGKQVLLVVCQAPVGRLHYHNFYTMGYYLFEISQGRWRLFKRFGEDKESMDDDVNGFDIIEIGKNKKALVSKYNHAGNGHMAQAYNLRHLSLDSLKYLGSMDLFYSNWQWNGLDVPEKAPCDRVEEYQLSFEVVKSDKVWYDIKQLKKNYNFTRGCKNKYVDSREKLLYKFNGKAYVNVLKRNSELDE